MPLFEVHYQQADTIGEKLVEATSPEEAWRLFVAQQRQQPPEQEPKQVLCVLRH